MLFPFESLHVPRRQDQRSLTSLVKENVANQVLPAPRNKNTTYKPCALEKRVEMKIEEFDIKGAMRIISSNDTLAKMNEDNVKKLRDLHPVPSRRLEMPEPPSDNTRCIQVDENAVSKAI